MCDSDPFHVYNILMILYSYSLDKSSNLHIGYTLLYPHWHCLQMPK